MARATLRTRRPQRCPVPELWPAAQPQGPGTGLRRPSRARDRCLRSEEWGSPLMSRPVLGCVASCPFSSTLALSSSAWSPGLCFLMEQLSLFRGEGQTAVRRTAGLRAQAVAPASVSPVGLRR